MRSASRAAASSFAIFSESADSLDCSSSTFARYVRSARSRERFLRGGDLRLILLRQRRAVRVEVARALARRRRSAAAARSRSRCRRSAPRSGRDWPAPRIAAAIAAASCCWYCCCFWPSSFCVRSPRRAALSAARARVRRDADRVAATCGAVDAEVERLDAAVVARQLVVQRVLLHQLFHPHVADRARTRTPAGRGGRAAAAAPRAARTRAAPQRDAAGAPGSARRGRHHFSFSVTSLVMSVPPKTMLPLSTTRIRPFAFGDVGDRAARRVDHRLERLVLLVVERLAVVLEDRVAVGVGLGGLELVGGALSWSCLELGELVGRRFDLRRRVDRG